MQFEVTQVAGRAYCPFSFFSIIMSDAIGIFLVKPLGANLIQTRYNINEAIETRITYMFSSGN